MFGLGPLKLSVCWMALENLSLQEPGAKRKKSIKIIYTDCIRTHNYLQDLFLAQEKCRPKEGRDLGNLPTTEAVRKSGKAL